jgi:hypothetical protein
VIAKGSGEKFWGGDGEGDFEIRIVDALKVVIDQFFRELLNFAFSSL